MTIDDELKSTFPNACIKAQVNILYTANTLKYQTYLALKPFDISNQQYNILRILRGQNSKPVNLKLLTERMIDKVSNTSRLIDKLLTKGLVERNICADNRRQVDISITKQGLEVLFKASDIIESLHANSHDLNDKELEQLSHLLDRFRN